MTQNTAGHEQPRSRLLAVRPLIPPPAHPSLPNPNVEPVICETPAQAKYKLCVLICMLAGVCACVFVGKKGSQSKLNLIRAAVLIQFNLILNLIRIKPVIVNCFRGGSNAT